MATWQKNQSFMQQIFSNIGQNQKAKDTDKKAIQMIYEMKKIRKWWEKLTRNSHIGCATDKIKVGGVTGYFTLVHTRCLWPQLLQLNTTLSVIAIKLLIRQFDTIDRKIHIPRNHFRCISITKLKKKKITTSWNGCFFLLI